MNNELELLDRLGHDAILWIGKIKKRIRKQMRTNRICKIMAQAIYHDLGLKFRWGVFHHTTPIDHCWNEFEDGAYLDATADQFDLPGILIVKLTDQLYSYYQGAK